MSSHQFHVLFADGETVHYGPNARFRFKDGFLVIDNGDGKLVTLSHTAWVHIEQEVPIAQKSRIIV